MRKSARSEVVLVVASDLHLTLTPPPARAETQEEWLERQAFYLNQLRLLKNRHRCPLAIAGDIFDDGWRPHRCPPELTNFAIKHLPQCYAVPGQHDLPHHNLADIYKSAYWTLVEAEVVNDLPPNCPCPASTKVMLHGFPWGWEIESCDKRRDDYEPEGQLLKGLQVAIVHKYVWTNRDTSYPGAPPTSLYSAYQESLDGYDASFWGDNHKGFNTTIFKTSKPLVNCGAFQRRRADEKDYQPHVGLLYADGHAERRPLAGIQNDKWVPDYAPARPEEVEAVAEGLLEALRKGGVSLDFPDVLRRELEGVRTEVKKYVISALERS